MKLLKTLMRHMRRRRDLEILEAMDDRMLADIGLTRSDVNAYRAKGIVPEAHGCKSASCNANNHGDCVDTIPVNDVLPAARPARKAGKHVAAAEAGRIAA